MKKILSLFGCFGLILGSSASIISCKSNKKEEHKNNTFIIEKFKKEVKQIYDKDIDNKETIKNLVILSSDNNQNNEKYKFFNKGNIEKYSNGKEKDLKEQEKNFLKEDIYNILNISKFKKNLEELKKNKDFETLLNGIDLICDIDILYDDDFKISLKKENDDNNFFSNITFNYNIKVFYKDNKNIKDIIFSNKSIIVYTNNEELVKMCNNFNNNVAKDLLLDEGIRELINFCWTGDQQVIRDNEKDYEGYGKFSDQIRNYINSKKHLNDLEKVIKFIKNKYFKSEDNNMSIDIILDDDNKEEICIETKFNDNFINVFEDQNSYQFIRYYNNANSENSAESMFKTIFRNDPMKDQNYIDLKNLYFNKTNLEKWNNKFLEIKNEYLKKSELKFDEDNIRKINEWDQYKNADSIGKITINKLHLKISYKKNKPFYLDLNRFDLHAIYNVVDKNNIDYLDYLENKSNFLSEFTSKKLIKSFQDFFGIKGIYPDYNDYNDYLFNIDNKEIINILLENKGFILFKKGEGNLIRLFNYLNLYDFKKGKECKDFKDKLLENIIGLILEKNVKNNYFIYFDYTDPDKDDFNNQKDKFNIYQDDRHNIGYFNNEIEWEIDDSRIKIVKKSGSNGDKNPDAITFKLGYLAVKIKYEQLFKLGNGDRMFIKFVGKK